MGNETRLGEARREVDTDIEKRKSETILTVPRKLRWKVITQGFCPCFRKKSNSNNANREGHGGEKKNMGKKGRRGGEVPQGFPTVNLSCQNTSLVNLHRWGG